MRQSRILRGAKIIILSPVLELCALILYQTKKQYAIINTELLPILLFLIINRLFTTQYGLVITTPMKLSCWRKNCGAHKDDWDCFWKDVVYTSPLILIIILGVWVLLLSITIIQCYFFLQKNTIYRLLLIFKTKTLTLMQYFTNKYYCFVVVTCESLLGTYYSSNGGILIFLLIIMCC